MPSGYRRLFNVNSTSNRFSTVFPTSSNRKRSNFDFTNFNAFSTFESMLKMPAGGYTRRGLWRDMKWTTKKKVMKDYPNFHEMWSEVFPIRQLCSFSSIVSRPSYVRVLKRDKASGNNDSNESEIIMGRFYTGCLKRIGLLYSINSCKE